MKILVLNGSPKKARSDCMKLTNAFLKGMGEQAEVIHAVDANVKPCLGCYACWWSTPGKCCQNDDMAEILQKITSSDLVIFSMPLYNFGMPAPIKGIADRMLPCVKGDQATAEDGSTYHPTRESKDMRFMLISGCGFPNLEHNYEPLLMEFGMMFGEDFPRITCAEAPLLGIPQAKPVADAYLSIVEQAGREFAADGKISADTQAKLDQPMYDPDQYRRECSGH